MGLFDQSPWGYFGMMSQPQQQSPFQGMMPGNYLGSPNGFNAWQGADLSQLQQQAQQQPANQGPMNQLGGYPLPSPQGQPQQMAQTQMPGYGRSPFEAMGYGQPQNSFGGPLSQQPQNSFGGPQTSPLTRFGW